ncbi:MAG: nucleotide exchange factor GrpE [Caldilineae bacterium]|nr:MAG: nucleotide exchange factor GrpE [Caldilineae bacterium]
MSTKTSRKKNQNHKPIASETAVKAMPEPETTLQPEAPEVETPAPPEAETPTEEAPTPSIEDLQAELEAARAEAAKNLDGWQRAAAELANYKRRQEEQAARRREDITAGILSQLFPVLDDLDLAFDNLPDSLSEQETNWVEGFRLVQRKLLKILETHNVEIIPTDGQFDPNLHEAVTHEEHPELDSNAIIAELRKGYKMGNRVLRPSLVRVAR